MNHYPNPNWTPVQTHRLENNLLPFFINTSQHDLHHTEPMLEPFHQATTVEALASIMQGKSPLPFTVMPVESGAADKVIVIPHSSILSELHDSGLSLIMPVGTDAANFAREAYYQRGMSVSMFVTISEPSSGSGRCMLQAYNLIAIGGSR